MFKKWDIIIIVVLIIVSFIPEIIFGMVLGKKYNSTYAQVTVSGKVYKKIPLSPHKGEDKIDLNFENGHNTLVIKDNTIAIMDADCPDKVCMKPGYIRKPGQSLVCLPHKIMVEIKGTINGEEDDIILSY